MLRFRKHRSPLLGREWTQIFSILLQSVRKVAEVAGKINAEPLAIGDDDTSGHALARIIYKGAADLDRVRAAPTLHQRRDDEMQRGDLLDEWIRIQRHPLDREAVAGPRIVAQCKW